MQTLPSPRPSPSVFSTGGLPCLTPSQALRLHSGLSFEQTRTEDTWLFPGSTAEAMQDCACGSVPVPAPVRGLPDSENKSSASQRQRHQLRDSAFLPITTLKVTQRTEERHGGRRGGTMMPHTGERAESGSGDLGARLVLPWLEAGG